MHKYSYKFHKVVLTSFLLLFLCSRAYGYLTYDKYGRFRFDEFSSEDWTGSVDLNNMVGDYEIWKLWLQYANLEDILSVPGASYEHAKIIHAKRGVFMRQGFYPGPMYNRFIDRRAKPISEIRYHVRADRRIGEKADADYNRYDGSWWGLTQRMSVKYRSSDEYEISAGAILDKDKYEPNYTDFSRFFVANRSKNWSLIAGDFNVTLGQGTVIWTKPGFNFSMDNPSAYRKVGRGIHPATSTTENSGMRGGAVELKMNKWKFDLFASRTKMDAIVDASLGVLLL